MGGRGSGRGQSYAGKAHTGGATPLDIRRLARCHLLMAGNQFAWQWTVNDRPVASITISVQQHALLLSYRKRSTGEEVSQQVSMQMTPCHLGGQRPWFTCPSWGKRAAVLYGPGKYFACRHCCGLVYASQNEGMGDRSTRQADKIRKRLGWQAGILNGRGWKPKGMHWKTFWRLRAQHDALVHFSLQDMARQLGIVVGSRED